MSDAVVLREKLFVGAYYDHGMADMDKMHKGMDYKLEHVFHEKKVQH